MQLQNGRKRPFLIWFGTIFSCIFLLLILAIINDVPGGFADWRVSRIMGFNETMHIPLGKTPEEAIQKFRHFTSMQVIHREPVDGGILLFIKRFYEHDGSDLQVEYVRRTWMGWKWGWGGGYGIGGSKAPGSAKTALNYMIMPKVSNSPFPMAVGDVVDTSIQNVIVITGGKNTGKYTAKLAEVSTGNKIWFAYLPPSSNAPYEIQGFNEKGELVTHKIITDPHGSGSINVGE
jgi:hypothetical protein